MQTPLLLVFDFYQPHLFTNQHVSTLTLLATFSSEEEVGLDRTHPAEASIQHHTPSPKLKPAGEEEERPASQQLEVRH